MTWPEIGADRAGGPRCAAAHPDDPSPCEGDRAAVRICDRHGSEVTGCVHHAARMYASLDHARVYPHRDENAALAVYYRAQTLRPFEWLHTTTETGEPS